MYKRQAYPSPLNYYNFPCAVCTSVNEVICHGIPDLRPLRDGDVVNVDVSVYYQGADSASVFRSCVDGVVASTPSTRPHESLRAS